MNEERMMKWFAFEHLPANLQAMSREFHKLAEVVCSMADPGPERTAALRKLLEAKDAAVRARLHPGG
jgi:ribosomal protein S11